MNADLQDFKYKELPGKIIEIFFKVYNKLGYGFLEKVYENPMLVEFKREGTNAVAQFPIKVNYPGRSVGEYFADVFIKNKVVLEIKAAKNLADEYEAQLLNYPRATDVEVGLLLNFGPKPKIFRRAFNNESK